MPFVKFSYMVTTSELRISEELVSKFNKCTNQTATNQRKPTHVRTWYRELKNSANRGPTKRRFPLRINSHTPPKLKFRIKNKKKKENYTSNKHMKGRCLYLALFLSTLLLATGARTDAALVGGWKPIEDPNDPHVIEIGQFAVVEYNKQSKVELKFQSVEKGETQVVSGTNYRLVVAAQDGTATNKYQAVVWENAKQIKKLTSFHRL